MINPWVSSIHYTGLGLVTTQLINSGSRLAELRSSDGYPIEKTHFLTGLGAGATTFLQILLAELRRFRGARRIGYVAVALNLAQVATGLLSVTAHPSEDPHPVRNWELGLAILQGGLSVYGLGRAHWASIVLYQRALEGQIPSLHRLIGRHERGSWEAQRWLRQLAFDDPACFDGKTEFLERLIVQEAEARAVILPKILAGTADDSSNDLIVRLLGRDASVFEPAHVPDLLGHLARSPRRRRFILEQLVSARPDLAGRIVEASGDYLFDPSFQPPLFKAWDRLARLAQRRLVLSWQESLAGGETPTGRVAARLYRCYDPRSFPAFVDTYRQQGFAEISRLPTPLLEVVFHAQRQVSGDLGQRRAQIIGEELLRRADADRELVGRIREFVTA